MKVSNALPLNALAKGFKGKVYVEEIDPKTVANLIRDATCVVSYVRHEALASLLGLPCSPGLATIEPGDLIIVVTLATPARGQEVTQLDWSDLRAWQIKTPGSVG